MSLTISQNILSLDYSGGDSLKVNLINDVPISGIELYIDGIQITDIEGGTASENGFYLSGTGQKVIGFSLSGASIPAGNEHLMTIFFNSDSVLVPPCFKLGNNPDNGNLPYCELSDASGEGLEGLELGPCVEGCFNNQACNFLEATECELEVTYYQDADNDGNGNPDITQDSCEPIDGYVANSDDANDTCSGTISEIDESCCLSSVFDACGICDGDNSSCTDCAGVANGTSSPDACGICDGDNSSCTDCAGVVNGTLLLDACGNCGGDCIADNNDKIVCSGIINTPENLVISDCSGECGGDSSIDSCGECNGDDACLSSEDYIPYSVSIVSTYPNPFNPSINIEYSVASIGHVNLQIIDLTGKHIDLITNSMQTQGTYNVQWSPKNIPSGMYLIQLKANSQIQNKKIVYLK